MATTEADKNQAADDFAAGYQDEKTPADIGDDEAFGLTPEPGEAAGAGEPTGSAPTETIAADPADPAQDAGGEAAAPAAQAEEPTAAAPALDVEKETQRLKSWEGRLKAQAADLAAKAKEEPAEAPKDEGLESAGGEDAGAKIDKGGEGGDGDKDLKALADDFGPEFVALITAIIQRVAKQCATEAATEHTAPYRKDIDAVIAELHDDKQRAHYEKIADSHPDFMDIADSDGFKSWIDGLEPAQKAHTEQVAKSGNAKQIIAMLEQYKATLAAPASSDQSHESHEDMSSAIDNAEGVRSSGLKLPDTPSSQDDFAAAWNQH
ncbi:hypothetical protein AAKU55_005264 [Oxalobacteraceae bacterium GrIS 1.11]